MATVTSSEVSPLAEGNLKFAKSFYNQIRSTSGNIFFSPLSIQTVLALADAGAGGKTSEQLKSVLNLLPTKEESAKAVGDLMNQLNKANSSVVLNIANAVYADKKFEIKPEFLNSATKNFQAHVERVEFAKADQAAENINSWVAGKTNNKIQKLIEAKDLNELTKAVLLNAIYFKGEWALKFPESATAKKPFHLNEKESKDIDFMTVKGHFKIAKTDGAQIVEIPYKDDVSMVVVVPDETEGLSAIEGRFSDLDVNALLKDARKREIILSMPKFKLEQTIELNDILKKMGITDLFDENAANLSGMSDLQLFVSKAVQKSYIEVNEEGSEAAAATDLSGYHQLQLNVGKNLTEVVKCAHDLPNVQCWNSQYELCQKNLNNSHFHSTIRYCRW